jgi:tripartite-type tricarboxylate transporter receptor subunit TctC
MKFFRGQFFRVAADAAALRRSYLASPGRKLVRLSRCVSSCRLRPARLTNRRDTMTIPHRPIACAAVIAFISSFTAAGPNALAQATRTIKIVVPAAPGGVADTAARLFGDQIGRAQGITVLIEGRTGAGGVIAAEAVARAAPDGNTILMTLTDLLIPPHVRKQNFDLLTSFEPICKLVSAPTVFVVGSASPYRNLADLLNAARAKPGTLTLASFGPATSTQVAFEMLKRAAKVDMIFLPYPGAAPAISALLGDHVTAAFSTYSTASEQLNAGKLRALATASLTRIESLPEVPTVAETGYKDYELDVMSVPRARRRGGGHARRSPRNLVNHS